MDIEEGINDFFKQEEKIVDHYIIEAVIFLYQRKTKWFGFGDLFEGIDEKLKSFYESSKFQRNKSFFTDLARNASENGKSVEISKHSGKVFFNKKKIGEKRKYLYQITPELEKRLDKYLSTKTNKDVEEQNKTLESKNGKVCSFCKNICSPNARMCPKCGDPFDESN